jgi:hypothetical protein
MSNQPALFYESINDALRDLVATLGGLKPVGARLRPELGADHAGRWLSDCLNADRREHLTPEQVMFLLIEGRKAGLHGAMTWLASECGYSAPAPLEPQDERAELQRAFVAATHHQAHILARMERLAGIPQPDIRIRAV